MISLQNKINCLCDSYKLHEAFNFSNHNSLFHLVLILSYYLNMVEPGQEQSEASKGEYDDISLNNKPEKELTCKYRTGIKINDKINHLSENYGISKNLLKKGVP